MVTDYRRERARGIVYDGAMLLVLALLALVLSWVLNQFPRSAAYSVEALPTMLPRSGLSGVERLPGWSRPYRWMGEEATLAPPNPGGAVLMRLVLGGGPGRTVPVVLRAGKTQLSFVVEPPPRTYALLLPPAPSERLTLVLNAPTVREAGRDLGLMVSDIRVSGGGAVPGQVVLALLAASAGGYLLLRRGDGERGERTGNRGRERAWRVRWGATIVALQVGVLAWQVLGGWTYALFGAGLWLACAASVGAVVLDMLIPCSSPPLPSPHLPSPGPRWLLPLVLLLVLVVRLPWLTAPDPVGDLELAARRMWHLANGGLAGAYIYEGDYMPLRLYLLYGLSRLVALVGESSFHAPLPPITLVLIKLPGLLADLATVTIIYAWSRRWQGAGRATALAALYGLAPPVWINVAWWGQVDALLMLPLVGTVVLLERAGGRWSWLCWTLALLIKPQSLVLAPLLYAATLRLHGVRGIAQGAGVAAGGFVLGCVPLVLAHQGPGLMQAYLGSVGRFPKLTIGAYNLWYLISLGKGGDDEMLLAGLVNYRLVGLVLVAGAAALVMLAMLRRADGLARVRGAAVLALAFFLLPTQIHERYLFLSLAFLVLWAAGEGWVLVPYLVLVTTATLNILGTLDGFVPLAHGFIQSSPLPFVCAAVNLVVLVVLGGRMLAGREPSGTIGKKRKKAQ